MSSIFMTIGLTLTGGILIANIVVTMVLNLTFSLFDICFYAYNSIFKKTKIIKGIPTLKYQLKCQEIRSANFP